MAEKRLAVLKCNRCNVRFEGSAWAEQVVGQRSSGWVLAKDSARDEKCPECGTESVRTLNLVKTA